jgi:hypothetical protein
VSYRNGSYRKVPNIRVRPIPEMECCLVFTPDDPDIHTLNASAWLVFELCDGRNWDELAREFHEAVEPLRTPAEVRQELLAAIETLERNGIVERCPERRQRRRSSTEGKGRGT